MTETDAGKPNGRFGLKAFARDGRGVIMVMFALLLPVFVGFIGLAVEVGYWYQNHRDLQAAADAAALAGSYEIAEDRASNVGTIAQREAENNGWSSTGGTITIRADQFNSTFPASGSYTTDSDAVEIQLTRSVNLLVAGYFLDSARTINARAVGLAVAGANTACVLALGSGLSTGQSAITSSGGASVTMSGCVVSTNSTNSAAIKLSGGGTITADCVYSSGGVSGTPTTTNCSGAKENQPAVSDPYASIAQPSFSACSNPADKYSISGSTVDTISDGVYCSISSSSSGTLTMNAGTYFLDGGDFKISGSGNVDGTARRHRHLGRQQRRQQLWQRQHHRRRRNRHDGADVGHLFGHPVLPPYQLLGDRPEHVVHRQFIEHRDRRHLCAEQGHQHIGRHLCHRQLPAIDRQRDRVLRIGNHRQRLRQCRHL